MTPSSSDTGSGSSTVAGRGSPADAAPGNNHRCLACTILGEEILPFERRRILFTDPLMDPHHQHSMSSAGLVYKSICATCGTINEIKLLRCEFIISISVYIVLYMYLMYVYIIA